MDFQYTEEQRLLLDSLERLLARSYDFAARSRIGASEAGYSAEVWRAFADMGLLALPFAVADGGFGAGALDLAGPMQALGAALVVEPYAATLAPAGRLVARTGSEAQRAAWLPGVIDGSTKLAFAWLESDTRYALAPVRTRAERSGHAGGSESFARAARTGDAAAGSAAGAAGAAGGWVLHGEKRMVMHAPMADRLVVTARGAHPEGGDPRLLAFVVDARAQGVTMRTMRTADERLAADVSFDAVALPADALLGDASGSLAAIEEAVDFAIVLGCAEAVGILRWVNDATIEYLKTRRQFGVSLGSFQALQHRMVEMTIVAEQARSITWLACAKVDAAARGEIDAKERARVVSAAKLLVADACRHVGQEAIQLHGGMGMTQEMKVSHAFRRLTLLAQEFGDADHHLERYALL